MLSINVTPGVDLIVDFTIHAVPGDVPASFVEATNVHPGNSNFVVVVPGAEVISGNAIRCGIARKPGTSAIFEFHQNGATIPVQGGDPTLRIKSGNKKASKLVGLA